MVTLKLTSDSEALAESKVLILYILNKIAKPISNDALLNVVLGVTDMNYFYFQQFLIDLSENGYIMNYTKDCHTLYEITQFGKDTLELTSNIIPGIIKLRVDSNYKNEIESFEDEHSVVAEYSPKSENHFDISCKIVERNETIFEVKTIVGSNSQAKDIVENWKKHANIIYPKMLETISKNYETNNENS